MHILRLIKGMSYSGAVQADREHPEVAVYDEEAYQSAMASGYFQDCTPPSAQCVAQQDGTGGIPVPDGTEEGLKAQEVPRQEHSGTAEDKEISIEHMKMEEIKAYAVLNGIDISGMKKKEDMVNAVRDAEKKAAEAREALRMG